MNKLILTAAFTLALGAGAASAQQYAANTVQPSPAVTTHLHARLAELHSEHAFGLYTASALARNVGPGSTMGGRPDTSPFANGSAYAPSAGPIDGGGR